MATRRSSVRRAPAPGSGRLLDATLRYLKALVGFDTRNPPRAIGTDGIFDYLREQLRGFEVQLFDHGAGAVSLYAIRGKPKTLFNVHLDTVPDSPRWSQNPLDLRVVEDRAIGLGACDIKGAAAALLAVAHATTGELALLFTTDEEGADPRCIRAFINAVAHPVDGIRTQIPAFETVIVAEPTGCKAILAHRGILSVRVRFEGRAGHASRKQHPEDSALHQAIRWSAAALTWAGGQSAVSFGNLRGLRFNIGRIEGGIKPNVVAPDAEVRFGLRPLPCSDADALLERLRTLTQPEPARFEPSFCGPALPVDVGAAAGGQRDTRGVVDRLGLPVGDAVDFWTEAALFSEAGYTAIVYGPGDIAQAHAADEWLALDQLQQYTQAVYRIVAGGLR